MSWNLSIVQTGRSDAWVNDLVWLTGYVLIGVAAWLPSVHEAAPEPLPEVESRMSPRTRLVLLGAGSVLLCATLLTDGAIGALDAWGGGRCRVDRAVPAGALADGRPAAHRPGAGGASSRPWPARTP